MEKEAEDTHTNTNDLYSDIRRKRSGGKNN